MVGSMLALVFGFLLLASEMTSSQDTTTGWVIILGALAYRSAKKRKLALVKETVIRKSLEWIALIAIIFTVVTTNGARFVNDPFVALIIPAWALIAYVVLVFKKSTS